MYVIIGQGVAGTTAANALRRLDHGAPITVVTAEQDSFYSRIDLPDIIEGKVLPAAAELQSVAQFETLGITCAMGKTVAAIRPADKTVEFASGECLAYDKLLLATGSVSAMPNLPGINAAGIASLWTMADARRIVAAAGAARSVVVVGAGLIGIKTALALAARGLAVTIVEKLPRLMPRQLDDAASSILAGRIKGIDLRLGAELTGILTERGEVRGMAVDDRTIAADILIMAIGVRPNVALAGEAGLTVSRGIVVDAQQRTSIADVYAAGDVAESVDRLTGESVVPATWPVAAEQGRVAAANMAGQPATFDGSMAMNSVDIAGLPLVSVGEIDAREGDAELVSTSSGSYKKLIFRGSRLRGFICLGDIRQAGVLGRILWRQLEVRDAERLLSPAFSFRDLMAA